MADPSEGGQTPVQGSYPRPGRWTRKESFDVDALTGLTNHYAFNIRNAAHMTDVLIVACWYVHDDARTSEQKVAHKPVLSAPSTPHLTFSQTWGGQLLRRRSSRR